MGFFPPVDGFASFFSWAMHAAGTYFLPCFKLPSLPFTSGSAAIFLKWLFKLFRELRRLVSMTHCCSSATESTNR